MIDLETIALKDLAGYICEQLKKHQIDSILVGGACVSIYSSSQYVSNDLDFVSYRNRKDLKKVLVNLGFIEQGKYFKHRKCKWLVEFVAPPVAVGDHPVTEFHYIKTRYGTVKLLRPIDSIKDRLASYFHWGDRQSLEQAIMVFKEHKIDVKELEEWSRTENSEAQFSEFLGLVKN